MTIIGVKTGAPASVVSFASAWPTSYSPIAGDYAYLFVGGKMSTASNATADNGFTTVTSHTGGTGTLGADTGTMRIQTLSKQLVGTETAPLVTGGGTAFDSWEWIMVIFRPASGKMFRDAVSSTGSLSTASDTTTASPLTGTCGALTNQPTAGDTLFVAGAFPTDLGSALGATTLTMTGLSGGTIDSTTTNFVENNLGNDSGMVYATWTGFTGTGSAGLAVSMTVTGATNQSGVITTLAVREQAAPLQPIIVLAPRR